MQLNQLKARAWVATARPQIPRCVYVTLAPGYVFADTHQPAAMFTGVRAALSGTRRTDVIQPAIAYAAVAWSDGWIYTRAGNSVYFVPVLQVATRTVALRITTAWGIECLQKLPRG